MLAFNTVNAADIQEAINASSAKVAKQEKTPPKPQITKGMLAKLGRAYKKAGSKGGTEADLTALAYTLFNAGIAVMDRSSSRIAKAIKGEIEIADLKVSGRTKKA